MAKVIVKQTGGNPYEKDASTVGELKRVLGLTNVATLVNKEPALDDQVLEEGDTVKFGEATKGGI